MNTATGCSKQSWNGWATLMTMNSTGYTNWTKRYVGHNRILRKNWFLYLKFLPFAYIFHKFTYFTFDFDLFW
jgi:hypothetical protein